MFKLKGSDDRCLFVKGSNWSIRSSLSAEKSFIESASAKEICPAHPLNFSTGNPHTGSVKINNWQFNKLGSDRQGVHLEEGGVVVRCSVHDADHAQWLVEERARWTNGRGCFYF